MRTRPSRMAPVLIATTVALSGCGSGGGGHVAAPPHGTGPAATGTATTAARATEPTVDAAKVHSIVLGAADMPSGFSPAPATETGDDSTSLQPCGHSLIASGGDVTQARAVFDRNGGQEQVVEVVEGFNGGNAASLVTQIRQVRDSCPQFDSATNGQTVTLLVTPISPPAVGEEVAGMQLASSARFTDVAIIRSGQIDAVLFITEVGNQVPATTMQAVVTAAGTKLAVGTGG